MEPLAKSITQPLPEGTIIVAPVEKKRTKPRKIVREIIVRLGKYQFVLTIWRFRK